RPGTLYVGTVVGAFKSTDGGATWSQHRVNLSHRTVRALALNPTGSCLHAGTDGGMNAFATRLDSECLPPPPLVAAVLPSSRSVQIGDAATAFATLANAGLPNIGSGAIALSLTGADGVTCGITQITGVPTPFTFQATDPSTNQPIGIPNTPVN